MLVSFFVSVFVGRVSNFKTTVWASFLAWLTFAVVGTLAVSREEISGIPGSFSSDFVFTILVLSALFSVVAGVMLGRMAQNVSRLAAKYAPEETVLPNKGEGSAATDRPVRFGGAWDGVDPGPGSEGLH